ncbi:MAG: mono/diheme cytochrome c family protein [Pseudoalteromonas tetraodonis]|jgi:mono/diheme cytochrome c family protein
MTRTAAAFFTQTLIKALACAAIVSGTAAAAAPAGLEGHRTLVKPFFDEYCIKCHGPDKNKGDITLHSLDGDLAHGGELERWEKILEVLEEGEMPPSDEDKQPRDEDRASVASWINVELKAYVEEASKVPPATTARRLTNFEYQNTMRDLLGFELDVTTSLPEDPKKPYYFNNTAEFMLLGPEQLDRYLENARRAMASAIVDPGKPEVHRQKWIFEPSGPSFAESQPDEIGVYGGGRKSVSAGMTLNSWPETGEYRIRLKAGAILPPGFDEVPLRLVMGSRLRGDSGTGDYAPIGTLHLSNDVDHLQEFEFRGRIENHPVQVGKVTKTGVEPTTMHLYAQNIFDNGQLNDRHINHFHTSWQFDVPRAVVRSIEFEGPVTDVWPPEHHTRILFDSPLRESDAKSYVHAVLERFMTRAFRRPVSDAELDRFERLYGMLAPEFETLEATMRETLSMVLISPQFLYHTDAGNGLTTPGYELASRLSYFLWGTMPDAELLAQAAADRLGDPVVVETQTRRLLADGRAHDFVDNFTTQWLSIEKMKAVNINRSLFPRFLYTVPNGERAGQEVLFRPTIRDYMHQETVGFVAELIKRNASVRNFVDSDFVYLNEPLAAHYGVKGVKGIKLRPVPIKPENHLGGLMTHGSVLVGNGTGSAPHPIYRAVWLREAILGDEVKPPPADVPALTDSAGESADSAVTIKDLLRQHRQKVSCNDCHVRLDPWGIPFERYNAVGQFQSHVPKAGVSVPRFNAVAHRDLDGYAKHLQTINTVEIEARARVPHGPEVDGMVDLKKYLLKDREDDIAENVIRRLLTYGLGRELTYRDRYAVEELLNRSEATGYALQDMIVSICRSETFLKSIQTKSTQ